MKSINSDTGIESVLYSISLMDLSLCSQDHDVLELFSKFGNDKLCGFTFFDRFLIYGWNGYFENYLVTHSETIFKAAGDNSLFFHFEKDLDYSALLGQFQQISNCHRGNVMGKISLLQTRRKTYQKCGNYLELFFWFLPDILSL